MLNPPGGAATIGTQEGHAGGPMPLGHDYSHTEIWLGLEIGILGDLERLIAARWLAESR